MQLHIHFPSFEKGCASPGLILCLCGAFPAPLLWWFGPPSPLTPDGTSFNIQNPIPHPSQKEKVLLETRRAKECQRGTAGAEERAKEGGRVLAEGSDTRLGARCREFESPHSDQTMIIRTTLSKWVMCSDLSFLLRMFFNTSGVAQLCAALDLFPKFCYIFT